MKEDNVDDFWSFLGRVEDSFTPGDVMFRNLRPMTMSELPADKRAQLRGLRARGLKAYAFADRATGTQTAIAGPSTETLESLRRKAQRTLAHAALFNRRDFDLFAEIPQDESCVRVEDYLDELDRVEGRSPR